MSCVGSTPVILWVLSLFSNRKIRNGRKRAPSLSCFETTPTSFLHWFVWREVGRTVSSLSRRFISSIPTCNSSLDSLDIMEQESFSYFTSTSSVSEIAGLLCSQRRSALLANNATLIKTPFGVHVH